MKTEYVTKPRNYRASTTLSLTEISTLLKVSYFLQHFQIFKGLLVAGIVAISGYGVSQGIDNNTPELSGTTLANIEALADTESSSLFVRNVYSLWLE